MEGSQFHLVVETVEALRSPYVAVTGIVEGGSISVNDRVRIHNAEDRSPKPEVERIEVWPDQDITTAEPGRKVWLLLRGVRKKRMIYKGDILERIEKEKRLFRGSKTAGIVAVLLGILVVFNLLYTGFCLLMGWWDEPQEFLRQSFILAAVHIPLFLSVVSWDILSKRLWRRKHQRDDWNADLQILKCTPQYYSLVILAVLFTVLMGVLFAQGPAEEMQALWEAGKLTSPILIVIGFDVYAIAAFLYYNGRKVFYSRHLFRLVSFGRREDIPWTRFRSITLVRKKKKSRLVLTTAERSITLRSEILTCWWGDFVDFARQMAWEYHIPFEERQEKK